MMEFIKSVNQQIRMKRNDGGNSFWCLWGDIEKDENGQYFYTEYAKENPRSININDCADEVKNYLLSEITI